MSDDNQKRRPILYNGQVYFRPITKKLGGGEKAMRYTYEEARDIVLTNIAVTKSQIREIPSESRLPNEVVISLVMQPEFSAKSYYPNSLFDLETQKYGLKEIGSRILKEDHLINITADYEEIYESTTSKMFFLRATEGSLENLERELHNSFVSKGFQEDIRKISSIQLLSSENQILGLPEDWESGRLEAVLHPFDIDRSVTLGHFLDKINACGVDMQDVRYKQYESGVSFISFNGNKNVINSISGYNPLRTVHPLAMRDLPGISRGTISGGGPLPAIFRKASPIVVGVIDGGIHLDNPYLANYAESEFSVAGNPIPSYVDHGTQVSGAVLYGALNKYKEGDVLAEPAVSIKSFGVLSSNTSDPDLYDAIDAIESIVPANPNISVYNLSLGPKGPIFDDSISRFTYSCDYLSNKHNILFCVAVGNDGHIPGYDRIQSPSDSVNCLSVGAYTKKDGKYIRAPYSSIGPGREGCKMKPDIMAFGGCEQHPIHLVSNTIANKVWSRGTSFSSPIVAGIAGRLIGESNKVIDPLIAKALLIHSTAEKEMGHTIEMGHGILPEDANSIVNCKDNSYTLIYRGEIEHGKYAEYQIPWKNEIQQGKVQFQWTIAVLTDVDQLSCDDYTSSSVEVTFYPNVNKYKFTNTNNVLIDGRLKKSEIVDIVVNPERRLELLAMGWSQSAYPITDSAKTQIKKEEDLKADLKWDSLDTRTLNKNAVSVEAPAFHVHSLGRGSRLGEAKVKFALVLTVTAPKAEIDLYSNILNSYPALLPLQLKALNEIEVIIDQF